MLHADDKTAEKLSETCPLRGRRCAELASGEFFDLVQSLFQARATTLELQLPRGLADDEVMQLMKDFEVARQHLVSTYVLKLGFWTQAPHVLAGLAHWDPRVRTHCLRKCLNSDSSHPKIQFIRNNMAAVHAFLASGGAWFESEVLDPLRVIACEMRLMFTSAWRVEGQHARTKKASQHAPHHSAAYTSLSHRLPEIRAHLRACPESASQLADLMGRVSNGRAAAQQLGFRDDLLMKCGWVNPKTFVKKKVGFSVIYHDDPHCKYTLELPERVQQTYIKRRELTLSTDAIPDGSVEVRRVLALHDVRKTASAKMFFSMKFNRNTMHSVISLLSPGRDNLPALPAFAAEGEFDSLEWEPGCPLATTKEDLSAMGLVVPVADLLDGGGDALSQEFVIGSVLHLQPSRFRRTHVEEEASLSGMWLVQLHSILDLNSRKKELIVSLEAANLGEGGTCVTAPLALHVSQLSLSELQCLFMWQTDDSKIVHRFDNQFMSTLPVDMKVHVLETARYLLKSPDGLALTTDMGQGIHDALELLCKEGLAAGPPWKLTELGHQRLKQGVVLRGQKKVLRRHTGDFREASTYQLLLELDAQGWSHQILTPKKHRLLKKAKHKHVLESFLLGAEEDSNAWYTQEGRTFVSHYYLLALVEMVAKKDTPDHIKEVPFGAADDVYKMLLGMDVEEKNKKHTRIRKRLTHVSDELWPAEKEKGDKKKKRKKAGEAEPVKKKRRSVVVPLSLDQSVQESLESLMDILRMSLMM